MAEADYRRLTCAHCGCAFTQVRHGRVAKFCSSACRYSSSYTHKGRRKSPTPRGSPCLVDGCGTPSWSKGYCSVHYWRVRRYGDPNFSLRAQAWEEVGCQRCGKQFKAKKRDKRKYCSRECQNDHSDAFVERRCFNCLNIFQFQASKANSGHSKGIFCSRECSFQDFALYGHPSAGKRNYWALYAEKIDRSTRKKAAAKAEEEARRERNFGLETASNPPAKECRHCGSFFAPRKGQRFCDLCADDRKAEAARRRRRSSSRRASKKRYKTQRRARQAIKAENIDPIKVFERDGWRCHLCGCKTPRRLRGTNEPKAPELDHIVSLADGGSHTWGNVACSCRACNIEKGAASLGQLGLGLGMAA